jgi:hypothetical protein
MKHLVLVWHQLDGLMKDFTSHGQQGGDGLLSHNASLIQDAVQWATFAAV